jgi:hypothetical protein
MRRAGPSADELGDELRERDLGLFLGAGDCAVDVAPTADMNPQTPNIWASRR